MTKIFKYEVKEIVKMPIDAKIIHIAAQFGKIQMWAEANDSEPVERKFIIVPTGGAVPRGDYLGTVHINDGSFVFHIYEVNRWQS